ncbi:Na+/H+ dicarboxylate symporter [Spongiibacter sp. IMCC21906]|jgi:proton glutamate symport protein|uniref:dicarboxylate/amino acid:cation symporter n=1 Tax=Spongiibacter sp. IMCC21906 TaxID=1620392 RepID=UPI00062DDC5F|nr:dicarboxylate/amino acid:cation symporter [Spongiibacter sp. IMCC21906]AKH68038.1 Na+/H+ dicarboxylate symporter [Spongiibacter sp. IMCC21906]
MPKLALHWQIAIAIGLAVLLGSITSADSSLLGVSILGSYDFVGTLFLNALKMLIVPLVMSSIISGMAGLGGPGLERLGGKTLLFYACSSLLAILIGLTVVNLIGPGTGDNQALAESMRPDDAVLNDTMDKVAGRDASDVIQVFIRMVPTNVVAAAAEGQMLGLIFFSLLFGIFLAKSDSKATKLVGDFFQGVMDIMTDITMWVMRFAPLGVFGLVAETVTNTGFAAFKPMMLFFVTALLALMLHAFVALPLVLRYVGRVQPHKHYSAMAPAMLTAFSTASSSATLPLTMECIQEKSGVSKRTSGFVLPLGATVNMDGTALYECVAAMFIAQVYGLDLSLGQQFMVVMIALLTSIGVAGIPAASLVAISVILGAIGLPLEGIGLLLVTDRILDMIRTAVNVFSDSCAAVVIARSEGEETHIAVTK